MTTDTAARIDAAEALLTWAQGVLMADAGDTTTAQRWTANEAVWTAHDLFASVGGTR